MRFPTFYWKSSCVLEATWTSSTNDSSSAYGFNRASSLPLPCCPHSSGTSEQSRGGAASAGKGRATPGSLRTQGGAGHGHGHLPRERGISGPEGSCLARHALPCKARAKSPRPFQTWMIWCFSYQILSKTASVLRDSNLSNTWWATGSQTASGSEIQAKTDRKGVSMNTHPPATRAVQSDDACLVISH